MSDTPRTDSLEQIYNGGPRRRVVTSEVMDHARKLERELSEAREALEMLWKWDFTDGTEEGFLPTQEKVLKVLKKGQGDE